VAINQWFAQIRLKYSKQDYDARDAVEESWSAEIASGAGLADVRAVTFIPSAIIKFDYWAALR